MLEISPQARLVLEIAARPAFTARTRAALAETYPHFLPRFSDAAQFSIVSNMLARASSWQLRSQGSLHAFCELMVTVAPNFDETPAIRNVLLHLPVPVDCAFLDLLQRVEPSDWEQAERATSTLPFFIGPDITLVDWVRARRDDDAIRQLVMSQHHNPESAVAAVSSVLNRQASEGLGEILARDSWAAVPTYRGVND